MPFHVQCGLLKESGYEEGRARCLVANSCPTLCDPMDCSLPGSSVHGDSLGKNTGVGCHFLLQCMKVKSESEVAQSCPTQRPHGLQHARLLCPSPTPRVYSNSCPLSQRCHPTISSSVIPFSSCPQSFPASGSFQMSWFFTSGGQSMEFQLHHQSFR